MTCAKRGMHVWMVDIDQPELESAVTYVKSAVTSIAQRIEFRVVDVSDAKAMENLAEEVFFKGGSCQFLMNNAAIGRGGGALASIDKVEKIMSINTYGPIHGCLAFVPKMKANPGTGCIIVNTGSKQGITMPPGDLLYNMSKAALKCYTEGLEHELRNTTGGKIRAALLVPGWVNTSIMLKAVRAEKGEDMDLDRDVFFHEGKPAAGAWMPQQVVDFMMDELDKEKFYLICPDNDVDRETDNLRMTWTMQDITENRPPLSRWHDDYKEKFAAFLEANKTQGGMMQDDAGA